MKGAREGKQVQQIGLIQENGTTMQKRNQERPKIFCSSMADVFDNEVPPDWRRELFERSSGQNRLFDWQILTKRPNLVEQQLTEIGYWEKIASAKCLVRHNNGRPIELRKTLAPSDGDSSTCSILFLRACRWSHHSAQEYTEPSALAIAGGETTPQRNKSRPSEGEWFRSIRDQCEELKIAFFFKQWGNDLEMEDGTRKWHGKTSGNYKNDMIYWMVELINHFRVQLLQLEVRDESCFKELHSSSRVRHQKKIWEKSPRVKK